MIHTESCRSSHLPVSVTRSRSLGPGLLASALLLFLALPPTASSQSIVRGELEGRVTSTGGTPLNEAEVGATDERTGLSRFATTVRDGSFELNGLAPGTYAIRFEALGYRPAVYPGVEIRPGDSVTLGVSLEPSAPPVDSVDTRVYVAPGALRFMENGGRWLPRAELVGTPDLFPGLAEISALSSDWDAYGGAQGLPGRLSAVYVDGVASTPAIHPYRTGDPLALGGLSRRSLDQVGLLEAASDVEWSGSPGGYSSVFTRASASDGGVTAWGHASNESVWDSEAFRGPPPEGSSYWGGASASLPLGGASSRLYLAGEAISLKTPRSPGMSPSLIMDLEAELGAAGDALDGRWEEELDVYSALARLDWTLASGAEVMVRTNLARTERGTSRFFPSPVDYGDFAGFRATDFSSLVGVSTPVGADFRLEVRAGFERSERVFGQEGENGLGSVAPPTHLLANRILVGVGPGDEGRIRRTGFLGGPVLHLDAGPHRFKGGMEVSIPSYDYAVPPPLEGFLFSDEEDLQAREGAYAGLVGGPASTSFTVPRLAGFVQYRWTPVRELRVVTGLRWDHEFLPTDRISFNRDWWELTGLSNVDLPSSVGSWGGRLGITWDVAGQGSTIISGAAGAHSGRIDPALFHEVILLDGLVGVRRALGALGSWPEPPSESVTGAPSPLLAIMDPEVRPPLTTRASLSLSRSLGSGATVRFSGTYRRTEYLSRRTDLNRVLLPAGGSNLDRPVYGDLDKVGSVVQAAPGSNRRFASFGPVWALNSDGWSEYAGASVALELSSGDFEGFVDYTISRTEDNWLGAAVGLPEARLGPGLFAAGIGGGVGSVAGTAWEEGTSDFDLPHRLVAGFDLPLWEPVIFGATFRAQSGFPFTPSYPVGTDVNADGSGMNDPAFLPDVPAMRDLAGKWDCLDRWIGRVAERNACRAPTVYTLDLRLRLTLAEWQGGSAQLLVEGFNLTDARTGPRDAALLLVDPDAPITGQGTGLVEIPTVVNPDFGELLFPAGSGRRARIGFRVGAP